MKNFVEQVNSLRFNPQQEQLDSEIRRMTKMVEDKIAHVNL